MQEKPYDKSSKNERIIIKSKKQNVAAVPFLEKTRGSMQYEQKILSHKFSIGKTGLEGFYGSINPITRNAQDGQFGFSHKTIALPSEHINAKMLTINKPSLAEIYDPKGAAGIFSIAPKKSNKNLSIGIKSAKTNPKQGANSEMGLYKSYAKNTIQENINLKEDSARVASPSNKTTPQVIIRSQPFIEQLCRQNTYAPNSRKYSNALFSNRLSYSKSIGPTEQAENIISNFTRLKAQRARSKKK